MSGVLNPEPKHILVIRLGHIGDVLVTTPVIAALAHAFPSAQISAVVNPGTQEMLLHNPRLDKVFTVPRGQKGLAGLKAGLGLLSALRADKFDLCLELSGGDRGAFLCRASGARLRVGFRPKKPHLRSKAFHLLVNQTGTRNHVVQTLMRQVRALGIEPLESGLEFEPGPDARAAVDALLAQHGLTPGGYAVVHPTSRWMFKTWTQEGNAAVIRHLLDQGLKVALTCAPVKKETRYIQGVKERLGDAYPVVDLAGRLSLLELGALIAPARLFFGVDSAPMHLAAALKVPQVVLFGPSGEQMWGPYKAPARVAAKDWDCRPCGADGCEGGKVSRCLTELEPGAVIAQVDRMLKEAP